MQSYRDMLFPISGSWKTSSKSPGVPSCVPNLERSCEGEALSVAPTSGGVFSIGYGPQGGFHSPSEVKNLPAMQGSQETEVGSLGWEDPLEEVMATHSRGARKTGKPCGLQSMRSQRVGHG